MDEQIIRAKARELASRLMKIMAIDNQDEITSDWLIEKHPELSKDEAEKYRLFCREKTIVFKDCYGDGEIMWPKWLAFRNKKF